MKMSSVWQDFRTAQWDNTVLAGKDDGREMHKVHRTLTEGFAFGSSAGRPGIQTLRTALFRAINKTAPLGATTSEKSHDQH